MTCRRLASDGLLPGAFLEFNPLTGSTPSSDSVLAVRRQLFQLAACRILAACPCSLSPSPVVVHRPSRVTRLSARSGAALFIAFLLLSTRDCEGGPEASASSQSGLDLPWQQCSQRQGSAVSVGRQLVTWRFQWHCHHFCHSHRGHHPCL